MMLLAFLLIALSGLLLVTAPIGWAIFGAEQGKSNVTWAIILALAAGVFFLLGYAVDKVKENRKLAEQARYAQAAKKAERERKSAEELENQQGYKTLLADFNAQSVTLVESLPIEIRNAENYLDKAEEEYSDSAFGPFWEAIERAAESLGKFIDNVDQIEQNASQYKNYCELYKGPVEPFAIPVDSAAQLRQSEGTSRRMDAIVRKAQRNFQFATIYEQRKTNQVLIAGFRNFGQAIGMMTSHLSSKISDLSGAVDRVNISVDGMASSVDSRLASMASADERHHSEMMQAQAHANSDDARRAREALTMLDNIQRDRKPFP